MVEMRFQLLLTCFFAITTLICCVIYPEVCFVSRVRLVDIIYGVYVDMVKFLIFWLHFHYYDVSILQEISPTLTIG